MLSQNARTSLQNIAEACGMSTGSVHHRIKKLEEEGVIKGSRILVEYSRLGYQTMAYIGIFLEKAGQFREVLQRLEAIPEVVEASFTTGAYSLLTKVYCTDNRHLMQVLSEQIQVIPGVTRTETFISFEHAIDRALKIQE